MSRQLAPLGHRSLARRGQTLPFGTRARVAVAHGDIEGGLALTGVDRRAGTAIYALRIANQSASPLRARMTCERFHGAPILGYPLDVHVAPFAIAETLLPVRLSEVGRYDRAIVKVSGSDIAFTLEAPAPAIPKKAWRWLKIATVTAAVVFAGGFGAAIATPHLDVLAAPARAFAGAPLDVPYAFRGWATLQYALTTKDGRQLAAGLLHDPAGTLHFTLPKNAGSNLTLAATITGPLGSAQTSRRILITSAPTAVIARKPDAPKITDFTIVSPAVHAGAPLQVHYTTNATAGDVWLLDDTGRLWANVPISADGNSALKIPDGAGGRQMRVVLHARNGTADALSTLGILVLPAENVATNANPESPIGGAVNLVLSSTTVAPGDEVVVTLSGNHGDSRVALNDVGGNTIEQGDVPSGQSAVTLNAPAVTTATTYYVVATVSAGVGEQTIVKKLVVAPR